MKRLAAPLLACALLAAPLAAADAQDHVYLLNNSFADLFGGPSLVGDGGTLAANGYTFGTNQGLSLSNVFASGASYSLVLRSEYTAQSAYGTGWRKMVDFDNRGLDAGFYARAGVPTFYPEVQTGASTYVDNVMAFTVLTRDASTQLFSAYVNGALVLSFTDTFGDANFASSGGIARLFEDDFTSRQLENAPGRVDYVATYDRALSASEVSGLSPVTATPEPAAVLLLATGFASIGCFVRRQKQS